MQEAEARRGRQPASEICMPTKMPETSLAVYVLCLLTLSSACYPPNCGQGRKRSVPEVRKCLTCGPEMKGHCFGPNICCGDEFGCLIDTPETPRCLEENDMPDPCFSGWKFCHGEDGGCAVPGTCCTLESCFEDAECVRPE
ncbi:neurophysin 1-like [Lacerta agilis]|uniref:neurophysin 1-like n=1 Tax=Lacerta agilis TaxID=80427 RepID=UPI001419886F|nr:neurophysin 1-like [Lacerta agilis]